ncbi:hypothetical protein PPL_00826 [Heterostelium album PN500]|uniref:Uncharacterized protein n=1 Tax=Heterostelium pallidum (strain ATCC 26659 / Pp 5 / PN500) TaxID=670386 RepID=D3AXJ5_HETP5|nr:hypothetical protein PPL_00826 [Heterostelium album PN500]EFA86264.1 hypothetical protein PPL_00826 [Heterostelium album PN500]|eukprot:XP_020438369.1 hypothetical protein PPL_00826 [Heterostelium album PN500]
MNFKTSILIVVVVLLSVSQSAIACVYDSECGPTGRCINARCVVV